MQMLPGQVSKLWCHLPPAGWLVSWPTENHGMSNEGTMMRRLVCIDVGKEMATTWPHPYTLTNILEKKIKDSNEGHAAMIVFATVSFWTTKITRGYHHESKTIKRRIPKCVKEARKLLKLTIELCDDAPEASYHFTLLQSLLTSDQKQVQQEQD